MDMRVSPQRRLSTEELMLSNCGAGEDSWEPFGPLEKKMAAHSSTLAWKIPWMEETGRLQSMGLQRVGHT